MTFRKRIYATLAIVAWAAALAVCFGALQRYAGAPGGAHSPSAAATEFIAQHRQPGRGLVVMAIHPRCPCTDASLIELGNMLRRSEGACDAVLLEYAPQDTPADWPVGAKYREVAGLRVPIVRDPGGTLAVALGAETSGHLVFADAQGVIRFHGGLTVSRGHQGRSAAQDAILAVLKNKESALTTAPVYGCGFRNSCNVKECK